MNLSCELKRSIGTFPGFFGLSYFHIDQTISQFVSNLSRNQDPLNKKSVVKHSRQHGEL